MVAASENTEVYVASLPAPNVTEANFGTRSCAVPALEEGQLLVRMRFISLDPYMRGRVADKSQGGSAWGVGTTCDGACVAEVVESKSPDFAVGEMVKKFMPWRSSMPSTPLTRSG